MVQQRQLPQVLKVKLSSANAITSISQTTDHGQTKKPDGPRVYVAWQCVACCSVAAARVMLHQCAPISN